MTEETLGLSRIISRLQELVDARGGVQVCAAKWGFGQSRVSNWLTGQCGFPIPVALQIVERSRCSLPWFFRGEGPMDEPTATVEGSAIHLRVLACASAIGPDGVYRVADGAARYGPDIKLASSAHLVRVDGNSMSPVALDGQHVIVGDEEGKTGDLAVMETLDGDIIFKRWYTDGDNWIGVSVNKAPEFAPIVKDKKQVRQLRKVWGVKF